MLTEGWRVISRPTIDDAMVPGDDGSINAVSDEHYIGFEFGDDDVFFIVSFSNIDNKVAILRHWVVGSKCNCISNWCEVVSTSWANNHSVVDQNSCAA